MTLYERLMTPCALMKRRQTPDGEGGFVTDWSEGEKFEAAIVFNASTQERAAEQARARGEYTVTVRPDIALAYHAVIKRLSDGAVFRIVSNERITPGCASFGFRQADAESWTLT